MDIFIISTDKAKNVPQELLNNFEQNDFINKNYALIHSFTYLMLDRILKEYYGIEDRTIMFKSGKPVLKTEEKEFSISHSNNYIALAFSDSKCGIDIENIKQRNFKKISQRMKFHSETLKEFYKNWTEYEAKYKLGEQPKSEYSFEIPEYIVTAVSTNPNENFDIYYNI